MKVFNCKSCGAPLDDSFICSYCGSYHFKKNVSNVSNVSKGSSSYIDMLRSSFAKQKEIESGSDYSVPIFRGGVRL